MAIAAIDEAVRNVVSVGADPSKIAILDNFCWPSVDDEKTMARWCALAKPAAMQRWLTASHLSAERIRYTTNSPIRKLDRF